MPRCNRHGKLHTNHHQRLHLICQSTVADQGRFSNERTAKWGIWGDVCASANPLMPVTPTVFPINAEDCHVGPNQRFDFVGSTIYMNSGQRCMSLTAFGVTPGLVNDFCTGSTDQQFYYSNGLIVAVKTGQCLDRTLASPEAESVLYFANCNESDTQQWQIK
jgi:hypothetical protein